VRVKTIEINGRAIETEAIVLSYSKLCLLADLDPLRNPSMTYRVPGGERGILAPGDAIGIADGLVVFVSYTGSA
jgi:hypothetical protein